MKHLQKIIPLLFVIFLAFGNDAYPQPRPPGDHGENEDYSPRPAPIGSGFTILVVLGAAYGTGKIVRSRKK